MRYDGGSEGNCQGEWDNGREEVSLRRMRIAIIVNMITPYTRPLWTRLAHEDQCDLLVVSETPMERDRHWAPEVDVPFEHVMLDSRTLDLAPLAVGSRFKTRFDTYMYLPKHPLAPLHRFAPDVVVAGGGGIWSSPANIAALAGRRRGGWAFAPWWGSFTRPSPTWPRRLAEPWVRKFMRSSDAWLVHGSRHVRDVIELGADPARTVIAGITPVLPDHLKPRETTPWLGSIRYLFVGRLIERKGVDLILDAFRRLDNGELWIAGDGPVQPMVEAAASADPRIRYLGHLEGEALAEAYRQSDVLLVPSLYEPWGLVVHEGLAQGLAVIVTDQVGAADDLIDHGTNGYVVRAGSSEELTDAMRATAGWSQQQWATAVAASDERISAWSIERSVAGFLRGSSLAIEHRRGFRAVEERA
jgi:glycosyltransferase involved in cell wall biosynthesis